MDRDGERVSLEYETAEVGRGPVVRVATGAVGLAAVFVGVALVMMVPDAHDEAPPAAVWAWVVAGVGAGVMMGVVRARVRRGRWQEGRAGRWAAVLLVVGLVVGMVGVEVVPFRRAIREGGPRVACASHMRQIGVAIELYASAHRGWYPDRLEPLVMEEGLSGEVFVCGVTGDQAARGATTRAVADALTSGGHLSYVYVGAGLRRGCDRDTVVMYEPPGNHGGGMDVLFADGHVGLLGRAEGREILDRVGAGERPVVWRGKGVGATTRKG